MKNQMMDLNSSPIPIKHVFKVSENELRTKFNSPCKISNIAMDIKGIPDIHCRINLKRDEKLNDVQEKTVFAFLSLLNIKDGMEIGSYFVFYIKSANFLKYSGGVFTSNTDSFGEVVGTFTELFDPEKKFIVDGELIIEMKGIIYLLPENNRPNLENSLGERLWSDDDEKDFTIVVVENERKTEIKIHKSVLSARSTVFKRMFKTDMKEKREGKVEIIDFDLDTVKSAVEYCYDQGICDSLKWPELIPLHQFADKYEIDKLQKETEYNLVTCIKFENVCEITNAAIKSNFQKLQDFCFRFLLLCLKEGIPIKDMKILDKEFAVDLLTKASSIEYC